MTNSKITPFVKRMRTQGGTIYTFSSALEDIGLNINERNNIVKMSHYALLNLPSIDAPVNLQQNRFNVLAIPGAYESWLASGSIKDGRVLIAESFQNYALNLEVNLLNQSTYNQSLQTTISERVFWKWLKETGSIRWQPYDTSAGLYWKEEVDTDSSTGYNSIVKCVGQISAGSVRTDTFGTYNETYVLVPTSFGQTPVYFKQVEDDNYRHGISITGGDANILGRETYLSPHPDALDIQSYYDLSDSSTIVNGAQTMEYDNSTGSYSSGWWWTYEASTYGSFDISDDNAYYIDSSNYINEGIYNIDLKYEPVGINFKRSKVDCISIEYDLNKLKTIFGDSALTFDSLATDSNYVEDDEFDFNAVLIYYSVYNKSLDKVLATNLLGILFLDAPSGNTANYPTSEIVLPSITKLQSGPSGFGTSYSFRLNVKSDYMLDDTAALIVDAGTSSQIVIEDFSQVFDSLGKTLSILNQQTGTLNYITEQYLDITSNQTNLLNEIADLQYVVNDIATDIQGTPNTLALFAAGDDPLVDSSIFMKNGKIGFFTNDPSWSVQIDASLKTKEIYIENSIRDLSGNIILGYGSPLQIGSSTNYREVKVYTGNNTAAIWIDTSNNVNVDSLVTKYPLVRENSLNYDYFMWNGNLLEVSIRFDSLFGYIKEPSLNMSTFKWVDGLLEPSSAGAGILPDPFYVNGSITTGGDLIFNASAGTKQLMVSPITGAASSLYILGQTSVTSTGGNLYVKSGNGLPSGNLYLESGSTAGTVTSGNMYLRTGDAKNPGYLYISGGNSTSTTKGGSISILGGNSLSGGSGYGGDVSIRAGAGITTNGKIFIGTENNNGVYVGLSNVVESNILYYNPTTKLLSYGEHGKSAYDIIQDNSIKNINIPETSTISTGKFFGRTIDLVTGASISPLTCVIPNSSGVVIVADADSSALVPAIAINAGTTTFSSIGSTYRFLTNGIIKTSSAWTPGKQLYLSSTGTLTQVAPLTTGRCVQVLGIALTNNSIYFNPSMDFIVIK